MHLKALLKLKGKTDVLLTRKQFDVLETFSGSNLIIEHREIEKIIKYSQDEIAQIIKELENKGYIFNSLITDAGLAALEPYRVKRAIFMAAGFGKRLVPITLNTPKPLVRIQGIRIIDRLIDACLSVGINEIYIVRGYLGELFDQLLYKYPMVKFLENPMYSEANNIASSLVARYMLSNAYIFEADLLIRNPKIIKKYHYTSDFLAIKKDKSDDWCFKVKDGIIVEEKVGGEGDDIWQMVGISYWNEDDGRKLSQDIAYVYKNKGGKESYWEQVPLVYKKENYVVEVRECFDEDIVEIDTFDELKAIDSSYDI